MAIPNIEALKLTTYAWFAKDGGTPTKTIASASASLTSNVVTLVTGTDHGLWPGALITVAAMTAGAYNGDFTVIAVPSSTSLTYAKTNANIASAADTGGTVKLATGQTISRTVKPLPGDVLWISLGEVRKSTVTPATGEATPIWSPQLGQLVKKQNIRNKRELKEKLESQEVSPLSLQLAYGTAALDSSSTQANPLAAGSAVQGWLKTQHYDQSNTRRLVKDTYTELVLSEDLAFDPAGTDPVMAMFEAETLQSTLNTMGF
jgi:hypothetical protein